MKHIWNNNSITTCVNYIGHLDVTGFSLNLGIGNLQSSLIHQISLMQLKLVLIVRYNGMSYKHFSFLLNILRCFTRAFWMLPKWYMETVPKVYYKMLVIHLSFEIERVASRTHWLRAKLWIKPSLPSEPRLWSFLFERKRPLVKYIQSMYQSVEIS